MSKRPKAPQLTWRDVRRQAIDDAARDALIDPESPESVVADAARHLNTSTEVTAAEVAAMPVDALRFLRDLLRGEARYPGAALIAMPLPTAPTEHDQGAEDDHQAIEPPEPEAKQVASPVQPAQPAKYVSPGPKVIRTITSGPYLESPEEQAAMRSSDVRKIRG